MSLTVNSAPELTPEEIFGTPEEVVEDSRWLLNMPPLKVLTALCLPGWHTVHVGERFRWDDEQIRLDPVTVTSAGVWLKARNDFRKTWRLHCPTCGRRTRMSAKGWEPA